MSTMVITLGSLGNATVYLSSRGESFKARWGGDDEGHASLTLSSGEVRRFAGVAYHRGLSWEDGISGKKETRGHHDEDADRVDLDEVSTALIIALDSQIQTSGPDAPDADRAVMEEFRIKNDDLYAEILISEERTQSLRNMVEQRVQNPPRTV